MDGKGEEDELSRLNARGGRLVNPVSLTLSSDALCLNPHYRGQVLDGRGMSQPSSPPPGGGGGGGEEAPIAGRPQDTAMLVDTAEGLLALQSSRPSEGGKSQTIRRRRRVYDVDVVVVVYSWFGVGQRVFCHDGDVLKQDPRRQQEEMTWEELPPPWRLIKKPEEERP